MSHPAPRDTAPTANSSAPAEGFTFHLTRRAAAPRERVFRAFADTSERAVELHTTGWNGCLDSPASFLPQ